MTPENFFVSADKFLDAQMFSELVAEKPVQLILSDSCSDQPFSSVLPNEMRYLVSLSSKSNLVCLDQHTALRPDVEPSGVWQPLYRGR